MQVFNAPIGEVGFIAEILKDKAHDVCRVIYDSTTDLQDEHPLEPWTMLQYSLHHKVTYWLRTSAPDETKYMAEMVEGALLEAAERAIRIDFGSEEMARRRLHIPARLKGGGIKKHLGLTATNVRGIHSRHSTKMHRSTR